MYADLPPALSSVILIEFHYLKACTNALSIQAVVERAVARSTTQLDNSLDVESCILPQDYTFIQDLVSSSRSVLEIATSMASEGRLRYAPLQTLVCITSSSIFLLKAISLGARHADLRISLDTLDRCIVALRSSGTDDMDFSLRYATLLEKHVSRFRANFVLPGNGSAVANSGAATSFTAYQPTPFAANQNQQDDSLGLSTAADAGNPINWTQQYAGLDQISGEDWWARPFDPNIAPFSSNSGGHGEGVSLGLELDSLDFLWNLPLADDVDIPS